MKYNKIKILIILFLSIYMVSCENNNQPVVIGSSNLPFVVSSITSYSDNFCIYTSKNTIIIYDDELPASQQIIAAKGLYNIGDTINICKQHG